jgi:multidrug efflux pump subunit AcrA (membrane-fusion protein)
MKRSIINVSVVVLVALILSACSREDAAKSKSESGERAVLISISKVEIKDLPIWLETVGQVHSLSAPTLAAEVEGRITMVAADTGDRIEEGQLLAETDTSTLLLQQQAAQANLERFDYFIKSIGFLYFLLIISC